MWWPPPTRSSSSGPFRYRRRDPRSPDLPCQVHGVCDNTVEQAFRWAKPPWHCDAFYLQNPERVAGLGLLVLLALPFVRTMRQLPRRPSATSPRGCYPMAARLRRRPTRSFSRNSDRCGCAAEARRRTPGTSGGRCPTCNNSWRRSRCHSTSALNRGEPPTSFEK